MINPDKFASDHLDVLDHFPDNENEAVESIASFVANAILSIGISPTDMFKKIEEYIEYYNKKEGKIIQ